MPISIQYAQSPLQKSEKTHRQEVSQSRLSGEELWLISSSPVNSRTDRSLTGLQFGAAVELVET